MSLVLSQSRVAATLEVGVFADDESIDAPSKFCGGRYIGRPTTAKCSADKAIDLSTPASIR